MKVNLNLYKSNNNVKFEGYKPVKSDYGYREYDFNYVYDDENYDCYLELFSIDQDKNGNYKDPQILRNDENISEIKLESGKSTKVDLSGEFGIAPDEAFGYHYKLYPKGQKHNPIYKLDSGNVIVTGSNIEDRFNIVSAKASTAAKGGAMKLVVPDINNVVWVYDENNEIKPNSNIDLARKTSKNLVNKMGGSLAGIEKDLEEGKFDNFSRIITTPLFTDDSLSAHAYWNKNNFQMAHSLGNINNYTSLQKKLFAKGINLVSDGALVNEGLEGVHFRHVLKWGEESPYFNWFRMDGLKDSPLKMGVFGKDTKHVTHRLVNSKYKYEQKPDGSVKISKNNNYNSKNPTYIQIYDDRLVDAENLNDKELIKAYDKLPKTNLDINTHNDAVIPYSFRIDSDTYKINVERLNEYNKNSDRKINRLSGDGTKILTQFEYFGLDGKHEGGFETWDANPDIAKLSYIPSHSETVALKNIEDPLEREKTEKLFEQKHYEAQDYAVTSAKFWSEKTNQILRLNVAQELQDIDNMSAAEIFDLIKTKSDGKVFPKNLDINENIVKNVLNGRYNLQERKDKQSFDEAIIEGLENVPLDSIEAGDDIVSVLATPYITKRAAREEDIGLSRYEFNKDKHIPDEYAKVYDLTDKMYENEMKTFAKSVISAVEKKLPKDKKFYDENGDITPYGRYVIPFLTSEIVKYAVIKSISPKTEIRVKGGEIAYDYDSLKNHTSLLQMGIIANSPEDEAKSLISKLRKKIGKLKPEEKFVTGLAASVNGTSLESFRLSKMIVERAQAGLDWRIDATKDVADIEAVRCKTMNFETTWDEIIKFWSKFNDQVKKYHPDAYIAAEVTDEEDIYGKGSGYQSGSRYEQTHGSDHEGAKNAVKKLLNEAGFTTTANYTYLSSSITEIFGKLFDYDGQNSPDKGTHKGEKILSQLAAFMESGSLESLIYSYTFAGNHDKCRALEGYAIDMDMVHHADLSKKDNHEFDDYRKRAFKILHGMEWDNQPSMKDVNNYDYRRVNRLAIAKCESVSSGMGRALNGNPKQDYLYKTMLKALKNLSNSTHKGKNFETEGFAKDFNTVLDIVFDEMQYVDENCLNENERKDLKNRTLEEILKPAMTKLLGHTAFLTALIGNPTLFGGDEYGATGFEYTTKNITVQNRNIIHEEWADDSHPEFKQFIKDFKEKIDKQFELRTRSELQPLNDGAPFNLQKQHATYWDHGELKNTDVSALLRQSPDGKMTISIFNTTGLNHNFNEPYDPKEITLDSISFDKAGNLGLERGIRQGLKFVNADNPNDVYYTRNVNGHYFLKRHIQKTGMDVPVVCNKPTLVLYHDPSFTGNRRTMFNKQYNFVSKPYEKKSSDSELLNFNV